MFLLGLNWSLIRRLVCEIAFMVRGLIWGSVRLHKATLCVHAAAEGLARKVLQATSYGV